jgi:hypothetical protein
MAVKALESMQDHVQNAAFMLNHRGAVCIAFSDPAYVRADAILIDKSNLCVFAILHEGCHLIGYISEEMAKAFSENQEALLTALRPDGSILELSAPIQMGTA